MPFNGRMPFLPEDGDYYNGKTLADVSMPFNGLTLFLHLRPWNTYIFTGCVNALQRAYSISTGGWTNSLGVQNEVSMPFNGLHPFLL